MKRAKVTLFAPLSATFILLTLIILSSTTLSFAATKVTPGSTCKVLNQKSTYQGKIFTCIKSGKKLIWNKGVIIKPSPSPVSSEPKPSPTAATQTPSQTASQTPTQKATQTPTAAASPTAITYTMAQVKLNNSAKSCWSVIDNYVYDLTKWINSHPGGANAILSLCGVDGTKAFAAQHENQSKPAVRLDSYKLGPLSK